MLRKTAVPKRICDRRRAQNASMDPKTLQLSIKYSYNNLHFDFTINIFRHLRQGNQADHNKVVRRFTHTFFIRP